MTDECKHENTERFAGLSTRCLDCGLVKNDGGFWYPEADDRMTAEEKLVRQAMSLNPFGSNPPVSMRPRISAVKAYGDQRAAEARKAALDQAADHLEMYDLRALVKKERATVSNVLIARAIYIRQLAASPAPEVKG